MFKILGGGFFMAMRVDWAKHYTIVDLAHHHSLTMVWYKFMKRGFVGFADSSSSDGYTTPSCGAS